MKLQSKIVGDYLLVYKPANIPTTPGETSDSIIEQVLAQFPEQAKITGFKTGEGGLLYRLDTITSGLLLFARSNKAFQQFSDAVKHDEIIKEYTALVYGHLPNKEGEINFRIAHHPRSKARMVIARHGNENHRSEWRPAQTYYEVLQEKGDNSLLKVIITKGARHQIRLHLASIGHPLCSDTLYGHKNEGDPDFFLECTSVKWSQTGLFWNVKDVLGNKNA